MTIITPAHNKNFIIQYENSLKEEINFVIKKIYSIFKDLEKNRKEEKLKRENAKIIEEIKNTCKKISDFLSDNNILITEYFDFLRIEYLINESIELNENRSYELVLSLLKEFNTITSLKYDLIHKNNLKDISSSKYDLIHKNNHKDISSSKYDLIQKTITKILKKNLKRNMINFIIIYSK